jgi:GNAT superfamily N-acetyltransferase
VSISIEFISDGSDLSTAQEFNCGNGFISDYLRNKALNERKTGDTVSAVVIDDLTDNIVGFFSIKCSSLWVEEQPEDAIYPTVEVVMFAVDSRYQGRGIGKKVFHFVIDHIKKLRESVGIRAITLFSTPESVWFYRDKFNFIELSDDMDMYVHRSCQYSVPMFIKLPELE